MIRRRHREQHNLLSPDSNENNNYDEDGLGLAFGDGDEFERKPQRDYFKLSAIACLLIVAVVSGGVWWKLQRQYQQQDWQEEVPTPLTQSLANVTTNVAYYSRLKNDRSGSVIDHMLHSFGYAYLKRQTYMGACGSTIPEYKANHKRLLKSIGLDDLLTFQCPNETAINPNGVTSKMMFLWESRDATLRETAMEEGWDSFDAWLTYLKTSKLKYLPPSPKPQIVVHVRRGDIHPCCHHDRYLPNLYFLKVIEENLQVYPTADVIIYSEQDSYESFDEFRQRGYQVRLGGDLADVWKTMISSRVLIISQSDFSKVPQLLTRGVIGNDPWNIPEPLRTEVWDEKLRFRASCGTNTQCQGVKEG